MDKKKEIAITCLNPKKLLHTIMCNDDEVAEYDIRIESKIPEKVSVTLWITNSSKKVTLYINAHHLSYIEVNILIKASENNCHELTIFQNHSASSTTTTCMIKGIAYDNATIMCQGTIMLPVNSLGACANQKSQFLLMSDYATIKSTPSLQVYHNQVECGHATTISYLDSLMLFYFQQRGITIKQTEKLIEDAFFSTSN